MRAEPLGRGEETTNKDRKCQQTIEHREVKMNNSKMTKTNKESFPNVKEMLEF